MKRVVIHEPGSYHQLKLESAPDPAPDRGQVLVETEAIGVNYADCVIRMGLYPSALEMVGWPITPGFEFAGRVAALGPDAGDAGNAENTEDAGDAGDLAVGRRVFGVTRFGGYATHVAVPRHQVFPLPESWTAEQAAGFPTVSLTAWYALRELCKLRPGMKVLVHSAAGGVGSMLVQIAKIFDAHVVGVVGAAHKVEAARALGADDVIDKSRDPLWPAAERLAPDGYDVVLDANGVATLRQSYEHLAPMGRLVIYGFHSMMPRSAGSGAAPRRGALARLGDKLRLPGSGRPNFARLAVGYLRTPRFDPLRMTNDNRSVMGFNLSYLFDRADVLADAMDELTRWIAGGRLRAPAVTTYPLDEVARAHADLESGQTVGKLVLTP